MDSIHGSIRAQQRGIPPFIDNLLDIYGRVAYDEHGGMVRYFDRHSRRQMERDMGREPVRMLARWNDVYKVISSKDGSSITVGHRYKRIRRK